MNRVFVYFYFLVDSNAKNALTYGYFYLGRLMIFDYFTK